MKRFTILFAITLLAGPTALRAQWRWHSAGVGLQRGGTVFLGDLNPLAQLRQNAQPEALPWLAVIPDTALSRSAQNNGGGEIYWSQAVTASFKHPRRNEEIRVGLLLQNFVRSQSFRYGQLLPDRQFTGYDHRLLSESQVLRLMAHYAKFTKPLLWESARFYGAAGLDGGFSLRNHIGYSYRESLISNYRPILGGYFGNLVSEETANEVFTAKPTYGLGASGAVGLELLLFKRYQQPFINLGVEYQMGYSHWWTGQGGAAQGLTTNSVLFTLRLCRVKVPE
jgi:hypothetical protein